MYLIYILVKNWKECSWKYWDWWCLLFALLDVIGYSNSYMKDSEYDNFNLLGSDDFIPRRRVYKDVDVIIIPKKDKESGFEENVIWIQIVVD